MLQAPIPGYELESDKLMAQIEVFCSGKSNDTTGNGNVLLYFFSYRFSPALIESGAELNKPGEVIKLICSSRRKMGGSDEVSLCRMMFKMLNFL